MGRSSAPEQTVPAARPERRVDTEADDIVLGSDASLEDSQKAKGKKALARPTTSGSTGLAV